MITKGRALQHEDRKFLAAIQGIDIDEGKTDADFEAVKRRAEARITGMTEEQIELDGMLDVTYED